MSTKTLSLSDILKLKKCYGGQYELGTSKYTYILPDGWSQWIEWGVMYAAPTVKSDKKHEYNNDYMGSFRSGRCCCGCYMGSSHSSGPVDPFGPCPGNKS